MHVIGGGQGVGVWEKGGAQGGAWEPWEGGRGREEGGMGGRGRDGGKWDSEGGGNQEKLRKTTKEGSWGGPPPWSPPARKYWDFFLFLFRQQNLFISS